MILTRNKQNLHRTIHYIKLHKQKEENSQNHKTFVKMARNCLKYIMKSEHMCNVKNNKLRIAVGTYTNTVMSSCYILGQINYINAVLL